MPLSSGDGGGILLLPLHPQHLLYQYVQANWSTSDGTLSDPDMLTRGGAHATNEEKHSAFYSNAAAIATTRTPGAPSPALAVGQIIIGTTRLWYTEETRLLVPPATETTIGTQWVNDAGWRAGAVLGGARNGGGICAAGRVCDGAGHPAFRDGPWLEFARA